MPIDHLTARTALFRALHLLALSFFALAWPLLDLLGRNPEFFVVRGSPPADIVTLALGLTLVPPLFLLTLEGLASLVARRAADAVHVGVVGILVAVFALQLLSWLVDLPSVAALVLALAVGGVATAAYAALGPIRSVVTLLALAPAVFLGLFFFGSASGELVLPSADVAAARVEVARPAPVVMIVFDEFPTASLLDGTGEIDAARFPHFAALARTSTWYPNATTVDANTTRAVPAILTGVNQAGPPLASGHPRNLFTLLGGTYRIRAAEAVTRLCPTSLCPRGTAEGFVARMRSLADDLGVVYLHELLPEGLRTRLPAISGVWGDFRTDAARPGRNGLGANFLLRNLLPGSVKGREASFDAFVRTVRPADRPTLSFLHVLLPHYPWEHLPSGRAYPEFSIPGLTADFWTGNAFQAEQAWQRHIAQVGYLDRLVGNLERQLRETGMWDDALVVLVADHGVSFRAGQPRKAVTTENAEDLAFVPLFVKAPGQRRGRTVEEDVSTLDVLPTIADLLGIRMPWEIEGRSLGRAQAGQETVRIDTNDGGTFSIAADELRRRRDERLAEQTRLFGRTWRKLYAFGDAPELVGRPADRLGMSPGVRAELDHEAGGWVADASFVPAFVRGSLTGEGASAVRDVAVVVNGRIAAIVPPAFGPDGPRFSALLPERLFRRGANDVRAVAVSGPIP